MALGMSSGDAAAFKLLLLLAVLYGLMSIVVYSVLHMKHIKPLGLDAPPDCFSEARAVEHVRVLSKEIPGRQEGSQGLKEAAKYIKGQLELLKERAGPAIRVEIEEDLVEGSFNMLFLGHSISLGYRNHVNIAMRISSIYSQENDPSVMVNAHFDSPLGSPGAGDCGSCVASMLEMARVMVDSSWVPPRPIIFLFNGAEELFMLGSHGFMKTHNWRNTIGAFVNVEASGTGGSDLVCQSGPGSWPSLIYAKSATYPMAHSAAQDVFPVIPGDTDYRMFSQDYGNIPGLDIIFMFGGYFYHTSHDTVERLIPGSIQARGDNLFSVIKAFANSSKLLTAQERETFQTESIYSEDEGAVFFDYLSWFMVIYPKWVASIIHSIPTAIFLLVPVVSRLPNFGLSSCFATLFDFMIGALLHAFAVSLAIVLPITFAILRLLFSSQAMNWFAHPYLAFSMFIPCSLVGLLIPRTIWRCFPLFQDVTALKTSKEVLADEARFWGAFGFYAFLTLVYLLAGLSGGFLAFLLSVFMLISWICLPKTNFGHLSLRSTLWYTALLIPCLIYSVYFGGFLVQFLIEKMGMMGSLPPPYGYFAPDIIVGAVIGLVIGLCVGPLIPVSGLLLARSSIIHFLLHLTVVALALSSQFFPYSTEAPKRLVFQHTYLTADSNRIVDSSYDFSVVDSNSLSFLFKHAPEAARELSNGSDLSFETSDEFYRDTFLQIGANAIVYYNYEERPSAESEPIDASRGAGYLHPEAIFPVSFLFSRSLKFPASRDDILKRYQYFPHMATYKPESITNEGSRKIYLELYLGSLEEIWAGVLNITGPLTGWSFADQKIPAPEIVDDGPPSYILRLSGKSHENWRFWLEASGSEALRIDIAVLDQYLVDPARKLKGLFPNWVDVTAYSSFMSSYSF